MSIARKILMGSSGGKKSTYVDDVFSTYLYRGNNSTQTITNGVDLEGEGGLVWIKDRDQNYTNHSLSTKGVGNLNQFLYTAGNGGFVTAGNNIIDQYNSNGFNLNIGSGLVNANGIDYTSWSFRKAPGFFDVVTYTGNGSNRTIAHNLGSVPGMIMVKRTDASGEWLVYHRNAGGVTGNPGGWSYLFLNNNAAVANHTSVWNDTDPTSSVFSVGTDSNVNANGGSFVAYIFGGGESTAATAKSVKFDQNYIKSGSTSDYTMGTGDFTVECWWQPTNNTANQGICQISSGSNGLTTGNWENTIAIAHNGSNWVTYGGNGNGDSSDYPITIGTWYHLAYVKTGGSHKLYVNGILVITRTDSTNYSGTTVAIGGYYSTGYVNRGYISNFRITKGQALYTSSFKPPTAPLTTTSQGATSSNVKLICCNDATVTGSTVTGATISVGSGSPAASTNSPFDDLEGFQFGEEGDQNLIKCGYYKTASNEDADAYLGWEPQWILAKRIDSASGGADWLIYDSMRGLQNAQTIKANAGGSQSLSPNTTDDENNNSRIGLTPTGLYADQYGANRTFVYMAIRRPDGLVGKPAEAGTDVFAMDTGAGSSTIPNFDSGFPVDLSLIRNPTSSASWWAGTRLTSGKEIKVNGIDVPVTWQYGVYDSNVGWQNYSGHGSSEMSWMWKRHAGFDVMTYKGNGSSGRTFAHSLGRTPEMMWVRGRGPNVANWYVYHKDLDNANRRLLKLENIDGQSSESTGNWNDTFPTATSFTVGVNPNTNNDDFVTMLFASVDGISKVGSYTGTSSNPSVTITTGFSPRLLIIKRKDASRGWAVFDTFRGIGSGSNDYKLYLNTQSAQTNGQFVDVTSTGFTAQNVLDVGTDGGEYIYYAHA